MMTQIDNETLLVPPTDPAPKPTPSPRPSPPLEPAPIPTPSPMEKITMILDDDNETSSWDTEGFSDKLIPWLII